MGGFKGFNVNTTNGNIVGIKGNIKLIDRGYEKLIEKLTGVGADIARVKFDEE